jgi:hypothetical protein
MRHISFYPLVLVASLVASACGQGTPESQPAPDSQQIATQTQALTAIGSKAGCSMNADCASNVCFHTQDAYPKYGPWESGSVCTTLCTPGAAGNTYCQQLAAQYNAPNPTRATCLEHWDPESPYQEYRYACDLIAAGLGSYWSE